MSMWDCGTATFAAKRSPTQPEHLGAQAGLIDEHKTGRIEIDLTVEPVAAALQQVGTFLLKRMCGLFLKVQPRLRSQTSRALRPMETDFSSANRRTISFSVISFSSSIMPTIKSA